MSELHLSILPDAFQAVKLPIPVAVEIASDSGTVATLEGPVAYQAGDALITGAEGERWPIARQRFDASYEAVAPTLAGRSGTYIKRKAVVWAWRVDRALDMTLSDGRGTLHAEADDVIVEYGPSDHGVVAPAIFQKTYRAL